LDDDEWQETLAYGRELYQQGMRYKVRGWTQMSREVAEWIRASNRVVRKLVEWRAVDTEAAMRQLAVLHGTANILERTQDAFRKDDEVAQAIAYLVSALKAVTDGDTDDGGY
jgi:hypothetical protein